jgi:rhombotail lipoprotein
MRYLLLGLSVLLLAACSSLWNHTNQQTNSSSLVNYLYPNGQMQEHQPTIPTLALPLRVGLAFVPQNRWGGYRLPETERIKLLEKVRTSFLDKPYIADIQVVPEIYLRGQNGFSGLEQLGRLHGFDVMALVSYDQVFASADRGSSLFYWTIVGAYVIPGTSNTVNSFVDTAVFDLDTRQLLFRAPGTDVQERRSTAVESERTKARLGAVGFDLAMTEMIPNLDHELERFSDRVREGELEVQV